MNSMIPFDEQRQIRHAEQSDGIDLFKLWRVVMQHKWSLAALVLIVSMLAALVAMNLTPVYRAGATLQIHDKAAKVVSIEQIYGLEGGSDDYFNTQMELVRSRALAERVVRELSLVSHPHFDPRQSDNSQWNVKGAFVRFLPLLRPDDLKEEVVLSDEALVPIVARRLMAMISVSPQGRSRLINIQVEMENPVLAAHIANALARGFIESQLDAAVEMSAEARSWMQGRLDELRSQLRTAEQELQQYREYHNLVDVDGIVTTTASALSLTGEKLVEARRKRSEAGSQFHQIQQMHAGGWEQFVTIPAILGHPLIQQFKAEQAMAAARVEELSKRYGPEHPAMKATISDYNAISAALESQVIQVVAGIERNYQLAVANEQSLLTSYNDNREQIQEITNKEFRLLELQREVEARRALYNTFMTRLVETAATSDLEAVNARVVDLAEVPKIPVKPKKSTIVILSGFLAGLIGVGLVLLKEMLNNTFKTSDDIEDKLNLPVLGVLPMIKQKQQNVLLARLYSDDTDRAFSEAVRTLRTGMVLEAMERKHSITLVTSAVPGEGKSTTAANLAIALGQVERVLLLEADLRRPTLAKAFHFPVGKPGLANLLAGSAQLPQCVHRDSGIDMISAGNVPPNPLELLSGDTFGPAMKALSQHYDRIVIDSPPLEAVSDAVVLSTHVHNVLFVIKAARTARPRVERSVGRLLQNHASITGIVLNQVDTRKAQRYGYGYGGYYEYYSDGSSPKAST